MAVELYTHSLFSDANLVSYYRMEGNSNDSKGSNNGSDTDITYNAGNGKYGQGAGLNGTSSKITLGTDASLQVSVFTYMAWVKAPNNAYQTILASIAACAGAPDFVITNNGKLELEKQDNLTIGTSTGTVGNNVWTHIAVTYNNATGALNYYINGSPAGNSTSAQTFTFTTFNMGIGAAHIGGGLTQFLNGCIDDVAIFSRVLTAAEILDYYNYVVSQGGYSFFM